MGGRLLLISAVAHFFLDHRPSRYVANLKKGMNPIRFYEYAPSSSLMIVPIGTLTVCGTGIILIFTLNATMTETVRHHGAAQPAHQAHGLDGLLIYGCIAGIVPWIVIMLYFIGAVNSGDAKPPAFVYAIVPTLFVFFNIFAINMVLQYKKVGPWKDYLFGERVYIILSLSAKTVLAWLIFRGRSRLFDEASS